MKPHAMTAAGLLVALCWGACIDVPLPPPAPPAPTQAGCEDVCEHWRELQCDNAKPSPRGVPCEDICDRWRRYWDLECLATVASCEEIEDC